MYDTIADLITQGTPGLPNGVGGMLAPFPLCFWHGSPREMEAPPETSNRGTTDAWVFKGVSIDHINLRTQHRRAGFLDPSKQGFQPEM